MALNNASADVVAANICSSLGTSDATTIANWKKIMRQIWAGIVADEVVTLAAGTVVTVGGPTTQTGPAAPIVLIVS